MGIEKLSPAIGSRSKEKRLGRGIGSGLGKTSGKGHKGQNARSGGGVRVGFEGNQMPLTRRLPKRGFTNNFRKVYSIVNLGDLEVFNDGDTVTIETLLEKGILRKAEAYGLKVLNGGELTKKLTVKAAKFSAAAMEAIKKVGGNAEVL